MNFANSTNRAFRGAYQRGVSAAKRGEVRRAPYRDHKAGRYNHIPTFSRGFIRAWLEGYDSVKGERREAQ